MSTPEGFQPGELVLLLVVGLHHLVDLLRVGLGGTLRLHDRAEAGAGVFGIEVDGAGAQGLMRHQGRAEVDLALDLEARRFERGGVELGHDELLGEVLGADLQRLRRRGAAEGDYRESRGGDRLAKNSHPLTPVCVSASLAQILMRCHWPVMAGSAPLRGTHGPLTCKDGPPGVARAASKDDITQSAVSGRCRAAPPFRSWRGRGRCRRATGRGARR